MHILLDENVTLGLVPILREKGYTVVAIAEIAERGMSDEEVWSLAKKSNSILIQEIFISRIPIVLTQKRYFVLFLFAQAIFLNRKKFHLLKIL